MSSNYVHLIGAEDVQRAGCNIASAAEKMQMAAAQIDESLRQHAQKMEELVQRIEAALEGGAK